MKRSIKVFACLFCSSVFILLLCTVAFLKDLSSKSSISQIDMETIVSQAIEHSYLKSCPAGRFSVYSYTILNADDITQLTPDTVIYAEVLQQIYSPFFDEHQQLELMDEKLSQIYFTVSLGIDGSIGQDWSYQDVSDSYISYAKQFNKTDVLQEKRIEQLKLKCQHKATARIQSNQQVYQLIEENLQEMLSSIDESSSPQKLFEKHSDKIQLLLKYDDQLLDYCFTEFMKGNQTDIKGHIMKHLCQVIIQNWHDDDLDQNFSTGQEWFDAYKIFALETKNKYFSNHFGYFKRWHPAAWHLTELIDEFHENNS